MAENRVVVREFAWRDIFAWLLLVKVFRTALQPPVLGMALVAALLTPVGWNLADTIFRITAHPEKGMSPYHLELERFAGANHRAQPYAVEDVSDWLVSVANPVNAASSRSPIIFAYERFTLPLHRLFNFNVGIRGFACYLFGVLWTFALWAFAGGFITRVAVLELGLEEQADPVRTFYLVCRRWFDMFTAPLFPLLGVALIALLSVPVGWLLIADLGTVLASVLWIFVVLGGVMSAILLIWLFLGWPLMWPAISAEETGDSFEAMSRSFAYAFQKPIHYLFYAAVATYLGFIGWSLIDFICDLALHAAHWSVSWGAGRERVMDLWNTNGPAFSSSKNVGMTLIGFVEGLIPAISEAFAFSYFFVASAAIYLLMRRAVDHTEFDEIWTGETGDKMPLPTLVPDAQGVPVVPPVETPTTPVATTTSPLENNQAE